MGVKYSYQIWEYDFLIDDSMWVNYKWVYVSKYLPHEYV